MKMIWLLVFSFLLTQSCATNSTADRDPAAAKVPTQTSPPPPPSDEGGAQPPSIPYQSNGGSGRDATQIPADQTGLAASCQQKLAQDLSGKGIDPNNFIISHQAYKLSYNFNYRVPNWVYYDLKKSNLEYGCGKRKDKFAADAFLRSLALPAVTEKDYKGSLTGYDRGHMAPSADFLWSPEINAESFFMTNMAPQTKNLNQRAWNELESRTRLWACGLGEVKIYTGPILNNQRFPRLESCVSVPKEFYKILVAQKNGRYQGIAFIYGQSDDGDPYKQRAVSIRELEKRTGIDFFKDQFAKEIQDSFETQFNWSDWDGLENNCIKQSCFATSQGGQPSGQPQDDGN